MPRAARVLLAAASLAALALFPLEADSPTLDGAVSRAAAAVAPALRKGHRIAVVPGKTDSPNLADYLTDETSRALLNGGGLVVLERKDLDAVREELRFQLSGDVSDESAQAIGKMLGAEVIVTVYLDPTGSLRMKAVEVETARILAAASSARVPSAEIDAIAGLDRRAVTVRDLRGLIEAIGSDRIIRLEPGTYDLSEGYEIRNRYVSWVDEYDGPCPVIRNVSNLTLEGAGLATLVIRPAYGWVLSFETCTEINLSGITLGHTVPGYCLGGVLRFKNCDQVRVSSCDLYGSGTYGIGLERTSRFAMDGSAIRDCTYGLGMIDRSEEVIFSSVNFSDTGEFDLLEIRSSRGLHWEDCAFTGNRGTRLFTVDAESRDLTLEGCSFDDNETGAFSDAPGAFEITDCTFMNNRFQAPRL